MAIRFAAVIVASFLAGIAIVAGLAPGTIELAAMRAREGYYQIARRDYETALRQGANPRNIVIQLATIDEAMGDAAEARRLLGQYFAEHPEDVSVARHYIEFLRNNQDVQTYTEVLEAIAQRTADPDAWRELARIHEFHARHEAQADALLHLHDTGHASFAESRELAELLATQGEFDRALNISVSAIESEPESLTQDGVQFYAALALAAGREEAVEPVFDVWIALHTDPAELIELSQRLERMGALHLALRLLERSGPNLAGEDTVRTEVLRLSAIVNDAGESFSELLQRHADGLLMPNGTALLVNIGLSLGRYDEIFDTLSGTQLATLPLETQITAIDLAGDLSRRDLLEQWRSEAGPDWRELPPLSGASLAVALSDNNAARSLAARALQETRNDTERAIAAITLCRMGQIAEANTVVTQLGGRRARGELPVEALAPLTEAALALGRSDIAVASARDLTALSYLPADHVLYARALTSAGRPAEALTILNRYDARDPAVEQATVDALLATGQNNSQNNRLHAFVYERLAEPDLPRGRRTVLIEALIDAAPLSPGASVIVDGLTGELRGVQLSPVERRQRVHALALANPQTALPYARTLAGSADPREVILYAKLLARGENREQGIEVLAAAARNANTLELKETYADALMQLGGTQAALPLLAELAESEGSDWRLAYEESLQQLDRHDELAASLLLRARNRAATREELRDIAYALLPLDRRGEAEEILAMLAQGTGPTSQDTESLVWLWGPRPSAEGIAWMSEAARSAQPEDRAGWIDRILEAGAPHEAAQLAEELLAQTNDAGLLDAAVRAYAAVNDRTAVERLLIPEIARIDEPATAEHFAKLAQDVGANRAASLFYERSAELDPRLTENLGLAGIMAFHDGARTRARNILEAYTGQGGQNAQALFTLAELDLNDGALGQARNRYESVIAASDAQPQNTALARLKALSLLRLQRAEEAFATYERLIAAAPGDAELRASAGAALLEAGQIEEAAAAMDYVLEISNETPLR